MLFFRKHECIFSNDLLIFKMMRKLERKLFSPSLTSFIHSQFDLFSFRTLIYIYRIKSTSFKQNEQQTSNLFSKNIDE